MSALDYSHLIGKYIRMSRPATEAETPFVDSPDVGMEGVVTAVIDRPGGIVDVQVDWGMVWSITPEDSKAWSFMVWANEAARTRQPVGEPMEVQSAV